MMMALARRLAVFIPSFLLLTVIIFLVIHIVPGDPIDQLVKAGADAATRDRLMAKYGLDQPLLVQYWTWLGAMLTGDLGESIIQKRPVADLILQSMPYTLTLGILSLALSTVIGVFLGILSGALPNSIFDRVVNAIVIVGASVPTFWLGLFLIMLFSVELRLVPVSGTGGALSLVLPTATLTLSGLTLVTQVMRQSVIATTRSDFVTLLHGRGFSRLYIQSRHIVWHGLIPIITIVGLQIGWIVGGAVTVEVVFGRPGIGTLLIKAINQRDFPLIQGALLMLAGAVILGNLLADLLQAGIDPRIRLGAA